MSTKLYPELLKRQTLDEIVGILVHFNVLHKNYWPAVSDDAMVLFDQISSLWTGTEPFDLAPVTMYMYQNTSLFLHRWLVADAIISARTIQLPSEGEEILRLSKAWVLDPSDDNRYEAQAASDVGHFAWTETRLYQLQSAIHVGDAVGSAAENASGDVLAAAFYGCHVIYCDANREKARLRLRLLKALEPILPDPSTIL